MQSLLRSIEAIAVRAALLIAGEAAHGLPAWRSKPDGSPVTQADRGAERLIMEQLQPLADGIPIIAEECASEFGLPGTVGESYFLVDALDGTREFIRGSTEFTVNIALVEQGVPVLGVVAAPMKGILFSGAGGSARRASFDAAGSLTMVRVISVRPPPPQLSALVSVSHLTAPTEALLARLPIGERRSVGSSIKFCMIASGEADVYPRGNSTNQWDTAAGDAVLRNAGGCTLTVDGEWLRYAPPAEGEVDGYENPAFIAYGGDPNTLRELLA